MNTEMPAPMDDVVDPNKKMVSFRDAKDDPGFLVAKGRFYGEDDDSRKNTEKQHVKKLASAIFMAMTNHGYASIRAVGPFANYNALKAITIATGYCAPKGIDLCWSSSFDEGNLGDLRQSGHVNSVTAMLYTVKGYKEWSKEGDKNE